MLKITADVDYLQHKLKTSKFIINPTTDFIHDLVRIIIDLNFSDLAPCQTMAINLIEVIADRLTKQNRDFCPLELEEFCINVSTVDFFQTSLLRSNIDIFTGWYVSKVVWLTHTKISIEVKPE